MRLMVMVLAIPVVFCMAGCQSLQWFQPRLPTAPVVFQTLPTASELVANIHRNSQAVKQMNCNVKVVMDGMPTSASGTLLIERPRRLRLKVGLLGMTDSGIDIGSNEERFWIFNKSSLGGATPAILFANHRDYENSPIRQTFQLQPQWLIDAMGLVEIDPAAKIEGPFERDGNLEISTSLPSSSGTMKRLLTLDRRNGVILRQAIYDSGNRLVAWARSSKHRYFPDHNVSLPQHIELHLINPNGQETTLSVRLLSHTLNTLYVDPDITWRMPTPSDVPRIDLTTIDPAALQQLTSNQSGLQPVKPDERRGPFRLGLLKGFDLR